MGDQGTKTCELDPWLTSASWNGADNFACEEIFCPPLPVPAHDNPNFIFKVEDQNTVNCYDRTKRSVGTVCTVDCDYGYGFVPGAATCTLQDDKITALWDQKDLICELMTCDQLVKPTNGKTLTCTS